MKDEKYVSAEIFIYRIKNLLIVFLIGLLSLSKLIRHLYFRVFVNRTRK